MKKPETDIKNKVYDFLVNEIGGWWVKLTGSVFIKRGVPDIIGTPPSGIFVAIEVKSPTGELSKLQEINLREINKTNGFGIVLDKFTDHEKRTLRILCGNKTCLENIQDTGLET